MRLSCIYNNTNVSCVEWLRTSTYAPFVILFGLLFGVIIGISANTIAEQYYNTYNAPQPLIINHISVTQAQHIYQGRTLTVDLDSSPTSMYPTCDRFNYHTLIMKNTKNFYPLSTALSGGRFRDSTTNPTVILDISNAVPAGDYVYLIRTVYICNIWPAGMITYHTETAPRYITIDPIPKK